MPTNGRGGAFANVTLPQIDAAHAGLRRDVPRKRVERSFSHDLWLDRCEALYRDVATARTPLAA